MPKTNAVWGIDIGQCGLKALRCEPREGDALHITATAFDFIEYPKILSQPEADPAALVREALELFLSRNSVREDRVAISVSGQSGLARFIKLPPVESKKIPDIVKYEARQQIPFSLDDVIWDYQRMAGGSEDEGYALEIEVGLFAMKRDHVYRALTPLDGVGIEVDFIQLAPLAIYNAIVFDQLYDLPPPDEYNPEDPPPSIVLISLGTDNTDLVVTNGYRVWQRSIPLGGNHFTKVLSKDLRLTFAKAEHLKRNATLAEDPKAVFQAMRPMFNDLLTEVQRSIGYFTSIDRTAKIGRVVALGNAMKLPGLQRYLAQNLGYEVVPIESYRGITGGAVTASPAFKENLLSFGVCYGLCLQGLGMSKLRTNLLPKEIVTDRLVREKKPWAVAALAALLLGTTINFLGHWSAWSSAHPDRYTPEAFSKADMATSMSGNFERSFEEVKSHLDGVNQVGQNLLGNSERRLLWAELLKAVTAALPKDEPGKKPEEIGRRRELHIEQVECERFDDLSLWFTSAVAKKYKEDMALALPPKPEPAAAADAEAPAEGVPPIGAEPAAEEAEETGPTGEGWVIELRGYHYHNEERVNQGATFIRKSLLRNLVEGEVPLPVGNGRAVAPVAIRDLGISYPVLIECSGRPQPVEVVLEEGEKAAPAAAPVGPPPPGLARPEPAAEETQKNSVSLQRVDFVVQFCWKGMPGERKPAIEPEPAAPAEPQAGSRRGAPASAIAATRAKR